MENAMAPEARGLGAGWALLAEAGPAGQAGFAVILLTCALLALRGAGPGAVLAVLIAAMRRPRG